MRKLIEILKQIEKRPGMYFGAGERSHSIHFLQTFILGFQAGEDSPEVHGDLDCFREWVATHYRVLADGRGSYDMILEHVGGDECKAFDEFFRLLPGYLRDRQQIGWESIVSQFTECEDECMEALRKSWTNNDG